LTNSFEFHTVKCS